MSERSQNKSAANLKKVWRFLLCAGCAVLFFAGSAHADENADGRFKVAEELTGPEKKKVIEDLIAEGDRYFNAKDYNHAAAAYESVFLLEPEHAGASARIDQTKKLMLKEGKTETEAVGRMYDTEIESRSHFYLVRARQLLADGKTGQARLELQKLLLLDPLHKEGKKLYEELEKKLAADAQ